MAPTCASASFKPALPTKSAAKWSKLLRTLKELGVSEDNITLATVPGALEVPIALMNLASSEQFDALIAIGVVIRGETYHF